MNIQVDRKRWVSLIFAYFGSEKNPYIACSRRAYLDMCRTIRFNGQPSDQIRSQVDKIMQEEISVLLTRKNLTQADYDEWHETQCLQIQACYQPKIEFSAGQAQKWLNMTIKYLYILGGADVSSIFGYGHVPLDHIVFKIAKRIFQIQQPEKPWSRIANYQEYARYQYTLRAKILATGKNPLEWEMEHWLDEADRCNL